MDGSGQNTKKHKADERKSSFADDVITFKRNLKIREILRTVKMNGSMRVKAPRGSEVMRSEDFQEAEDPFRDEAEAGEPASATNPLVAGGADSGEDEPPLHKCRSVSGGLHGLPAPLSPGHALLSRSAVELRCAGRPPLQRKSSFFRKTMDSLLRNTTEMFRKQAGRPPHRMSVSMQSLHEHRECAGHAALDDCEARSECSACDSPPPPPRHDAAAGVLAARACSVSSGLDAALRPAHTRGSWAGGEEWWPEPAARGARRLSYQRAVSREPARRGPADGEGEVSAWLAEFSRCGVPPLPAFRPHALPAPAAACLQRPGTDHCPPHELAEREAARQAVLRELLQTEADYIRHLTDIVQVYMAAAHALQEAGQLLELDTSRLFLNIPDVLNANLRFWELALYPMIQRSVRDHSSLEPELMAAGFAQFSQLFAPYEEYVCGQAAAVDYLRALSAGAGFSAYLAWCAATTNTSRLQLADILVKPMQRLTKYSLLLKRIFRNTDSEESRALIETMEQETVAFVQRVNRAVRQRDEITKLEELEKTIDAYEIDFRDEELDRYFRMLNETNLRSPMLNCGPDTSRALIHQGDLRFKDHSKEVEVRAFLFTDVLLICKKLTKGAPHSYKLIKPKFLVERSVPFARMTSRANPHEVTGLIFVVLDELGSAHSAFCLSETTRDPNPHHTLRLWEQKFQEARMAYELSVWFHRYPVRDLAEVEADYNDDTFKKEFPEEWATERRARELVAAMLHPNTPPDFPVFQSGRGPPSLRHVLHRASTGDSSRNSRISSFHQLSTSSRNSRLSSFQQSTSAASHDEPHVLRFLCKAGSGVDHLLPPQAADDGSRGVTVRAEGEPAPRHAPPVVVVEQSPPAPAPRTASAGSPHSLRVGSPHHSAHSLPDLSQPQPAAQPAESPVYQSASEKLYQSHQELLQRNRLAASQHQFLSPEHRGTSYPPPSPTRASLKRGLAFSYSFKNPPLSKMGHVNSQSHANIDQLFASAAQTKVPAPARATQEPVTSSAKSEKSRQHRRSKAETKASSPVPSKKDTSTYIEDTTHSHGTRDRLDGKNIVNTDTGDPITHLQGTIESILSVRDKPGEDKSIQEVRISPKDKIDENKDSKKYIKSKSDSGMDINKILVSSDDDKVIRGNTKVSKNDDGKNNKQILKGKSVDGKGVKKSKAKGDGDKKSPKGKPDQVIK